MKAGDYSRPFTRRAGRLVKRYATQHGIQVSELIREGLEWR